LTYARQRSEVIDTTGAGGIRQRVPPLPSTPATTVRALFDRNRGRFARVHVHGAQPALPARDAIDTLFFRLHHTRALLLVFFGGSATVRRFY
jgi:hypothetical protein